MRSSDFLQCKFSSEQASMDEYDRKYAAMVAKKEAFDASPAGERARERRDGVMADRANRDRKIAERHAKGELIIGIDVPPDVEGCRSCWFLSTPGCVLCRK